MCTVRVPISITKKTCRRRRKTVPACRKSAARIPEACELRNCRQVGDARRGAGLNPAAAGIRRMVPGAGAVAETDELALDAPVAPARVLPGQLPGQRADLIGDQWASRGVRVGPFCLDKAAVPGEQGARGHHQVRSEAGGKQPGQGGDHGAIGPVRPGAAGLAAQQGGLMPEDQDLGVLGGVASREERQPAEQLDHEQVDEAEKHECRA
jgi:hypothetical protein